MRSAARTARGPSRAPARFVTPRSIGTPTSAMSRPAKLSAAAFGRCGADSKVAGSVNGHLRRSPWNWVCDTRLNSGS